jgi:hypothetical protein
MMMVDTSSPSLTSLRTPFNHLVPKDPAKNIKFRREILQHALSAPHYAEEVRIMCARDILFWFNAFVYTYNPKDFPKAPNRLFILRPLQEQAVLTINDAIGNHDVVIEKSRDEGMSWMVLGTFTHWFIYQPLSSFMCISRKQELADSSGNMDSLLPKVDYLLTRLPKFLAPPIAPALLKRQNLENGARIDGESTTGDSTRGGRRTAMFADEFGSVPHPEDDNLKAATLSVTKCRIWGSTPKGAWGAFYDRVQKTPCKITLHWSQNPAKNEGLYFDKVTGKPRSPWYDKECERSGSPLEIAQELDICYHGAGNPFFDIAVIEQRKKDYCMEPVVRGAIVNGRFKVDPHGLLVLWRRPDMAGKLPDDREYTIGNDISMGTGASNSCMAIGDNKTGERVGEIVTPNLSPDEFAQHVLNVAYWLKGPRNGMPFLIWESNGPGRLFEKEVLREGYINFYFKTSERSLSKAVSDEPGWHPTVENKKDVLGEYRRALGKGLYVNRSVYALDECKDYVFSSTGSVEHKKNITITDMSGARDNHGDRVIADALTWFGMRGIEIPKELQVEVPRQSIAWKLREVDMAQAAGDSVRKY